MSYLIAVTGKGGVGKTTLSAILIDRLIKKDKSPVLAIDADPNSCLDSALGVAVLKTVGKAREEVRDEAAEALANGISKQQLLELKISESLVEASGFDLISMGRPEGAGCYCFANSVLKAIIAELSDSYPYVVLDNEAGLENLSRRIVQKVDLLVLVSDPSNNGLNTLSRLHELTNEMQIEYKKLVLVVNRLRNGRLPERAQQIKELTNADFLIGIPDDEQIADFSENNCKMSDVDENNPVVKIIDDMINNAI